MYSKLFLAIVRVQKASQDTTEAHETARLVRVFDQANAGQTERGASSKEGERIRRKDGASTIG
jgi:hypothetical protein